MCIKHTPFPIISTLSQYPEFKLNIHNLYTFDLEKYQSLVVQPPHTIQSPPKTTTFLSFPWIYILFQFFFHHATDPALFSPPAGIFTLVHTLLFVALIRVFYLQMTVTEKRAWWHFVNLACLNRIGRLFEGREVTEAAVAASSYVDAIKRGWKGVRGIRRGPGLTSFDDVNQDRVETAQEPRAQPNILSTWPSAAVYSAKRSFLIRFFHHFSNESSVIRDWGRKGNWESWFLEGCLE